MLEYSNVQIAEGAELVYLIFKKKTKKKTCHICGGLGDD